MKFNFLTRRKLHEAFQVNPELTISQIKAGPLHYFIIENFLVDPEGALNYFMEFPALHPPFYVTGPGGRQNISVVEMMPILLVYKSILDKLKFPNISAMNFFTSANILYKDMEAHNQNYKPHHDINDIVFTLWLSKHGGGTAFYSYEGECDSRKLTSAQYTEAHKRDECLEEWKNFEGDDKWNLYHVVPEKFNTVTLYNGFFLHSMYPKWKNDDYRYNVLSFYHKDGIGKTWENLNSEV